MIIPSARPAMIPIAKSTIVFPLSFAGGDSSGGHLSKPHAMALASLATGHHLDEDTAAKLASSTVRVGRAVWRAYARDGINVTQSNGEAAGQEVVRWSRASRPTPQPGSS